MYARSHFGSSLQSFWLESVCLARSVWGGREWGRNVLPYFVRRLAAFVATDMATAVAMTTADRMVSLGSSLGQVWKRHRRQLPPDVRKCFVELMASVGSYVEDDRDGEERSDVRECVELKRLLELKGSSCKPLRRALGPTRWLMYLFRLTLLFATLLWSRVKLHLLR